MIGVGILGSGMERRTPRGGIIRSPELTRMG